MAWITVYLLIGAIGAVFLYVVVNAADRDRDADDMRDTVRQMETDVSGVPGGMLNILLMMLIAWPAVIAYMFVNALRKRT